MSIIKGLFLLVSIAWILAIASVFAMDYISYYQLMGEDLFQLINREYNMDFAVKFMHIPILITTPFLIALVADKLTE